MQKGLGILFNTSASIICVLAFIMCIICFSEYYKVAILQEIDNYPFGTEGPVAEISYYENEGAYSNEMLFSGIMFFLSFISIIISLIKKKTWLLLLGIVILIFTFITNYSEIFLI